MADLPLLSAVEVQSAPGPTHAVIWLHGLGADGHDFEPVVHQFDSARLPPTRFVFPHAPMRPVTINAGYVMRAWYDIVSLDFEEGREDPAGVRESAAQVEALVARERARGIPDERIVLAGFSQGGAIALHTGLRHAGRLAGILALSTNLPVPIFMAHGRQDGVIPYGFAAQSGRFLQGQGYPLEWHEYPLEHGVSMEELRDIETWLAKRSEEHTSELQSPLN